MAKLALNSQSLSASASWAAKQNPLQQAKDREKLQTATEMFESQFIKMVWGEMRKTLPQGGLVNGGFGEEMFTSLLDEARSDAIAQGNSIGLAKMLQTQLSGDSYHRPAKFKMEPRAAQQFAHVEVEERVAQNLTDPEKAKEILNTPATSFSAKLNYLRKSASSIYTEVQNLKEEKELGLLWPVAGNERISSQFGLRNHPILKKIRHHNGIDIPAATGTPIQAAADGFVVYSGSRGNLGKAVVIEHTDGSQTIYGHCSKLMVKVGQEIKAGENIANVGSTGLATGPHLHFEYRAVDGYAQNPLQKLAQNQRPLTTGNMLASNAGKDETI